MIGIINVLVASLSSLILGLDSITVSRRISSKIFIESYYGIRFIPSLTKISILDLA